MNTTITPSQPGSVLTTGFLSAAQTAANGTQINPQSGGMPQAPQAMQFPVAGLPKPGTTPTGPTGVASSSLADQTLATQKEGTEKIQGEVDAHTANKGAILGYRPDISIVDLLSSKGMPSDYASRAQLAQKYGIENYAGTADQNKQLIGLVNNPPQDSGTSSTGSSSSSTGTTGTKSGSMGTTATPGQPTTGSPGDAYTSRISDVQKQIGDMLDQRTQQVQQIMNGTFPLTSYQQALLTATQNQFSTIAQIQMTANKSYEGGVALAGARLGTNRTNPQEYLAEQNKAVQDGLLKISTLDAQAAKTLADLQQGFMDKDYQYINDNYNALQKTLEDKATALRDLQKRTDDLYTSTRDFNEKQLEFKQSQAQQRAEFNQTQALERAKFTAQYAGLIDPNTGLFKPSANPASLPGVNTLPSGIGSGPGGHFLDVGQIPDKALAAYLIQAAKANGFGVVDTSNNKTFNQSLTAYNGLTELLKSGQYNANTPITNIIGNKKSSSLILRVFGSSQPDNIAQVLGAGGAQVPNLKGLTLGEAQSYLQSSIYSTMGTNSTAQKYAMNPQLATSDLQTYTAASPTNFANVSKLLSANPQLTDSQVMQILNPQ